MHNGTKRNMRSRRHSGRAGSRSDTSKRPASSPGQVITFADAKRSYERYTALARAAASTGDAVETENLYQHAEHYFRMMREQAV
jgi:hypothetical protein